MNVKFIYLFIIRPQGSLKTHEHKNTRKLKPRAYKMQNLHNNI